jgi:hypothetical protein
MKISIIHPSRQRPQIAVEVANKWLINAKNWQEIEYIVSLDRDDPTVDEYRKAFEKSAMMKFLKYPDKRILVSDNITMVEAVNAGAAKATGDLFIVVSDDFDCFPNWDEWLLEQVKGKKDFAVKVPDGYVKDYYLQTLPICDRKYYNRFGYIYNPAYRHMYVDTEASIVAYMLGRMIVIPDEGNPVFRHLHYTRGLSPKDEVNERNDSSYKVGAQIFFHRLAKDFGLRQEEIKGKFAPQFFTSGTSKITGYTFAG